VRVQRRDDCSRQSGAARSGPEGPPLSRDTADRDGQA